MAWELGCRRFVLEHFSDEVEIPDEKSDPFFAVALARHAWQAYGQKHTPRHDMDAASLWG